MVFDNRNIQLTKEVVIRSNLQLALGVIIYAFGIYLTINAEIGVSPWDTLYLGIVGKTGIRYGVVSTTAALLIVAADLLMGERLGFGTIIDALLAGTSADFFLTLDLVPRSASPIINIFLFISGLFLMALGNVFAMSAGQCCGPKDALLIALGKRLPKLSVGTVQILIQGAAFLLGLLLSGPVGIGTVVSVVFTGVAQQIMFRLFRFDPRNTVHYDMVRSAAVFRE